MFDRPTLCAQTSAGPGTVAVANDAYLLESQLRLQRLCAPEDLRLAELLAVAANEFHYVEFLPLFGIGEGAFIDDFSTKAVIVSPKGRPF